MSEAPNRYEHRFDVTSQAAGNPATLLRRSIARGEQITVAYTLENDSNAPITVDVDFNRLTESGNPDYFPESAFAARLLMWRDRVWLPASLREAGDPLWQDHNSNGSMDRSDFASQYPNQIFNDGFLEEQRSFGTGDTTPDIVLYRDPEPLLLYRQEGIVDESFVIPANESRQLWLVITAPEDMSTGFYTGDATWGPGLTITATDATTSVVEEIDIELTVPCWDVMDERADAFALWDYSYVVGRNAFENAGIPLGDLSDRRTEVRVMGGANALHDYVGVPSRATLTATSTTIAWDTLFSGLQYDLHRYEQDIAWPDPFPPFADRRVKTLVFTVTGYGSDLFPQLWGPNPLQPNQDWEDRFEQMWIDFKAGLDGRNISVDDCKIVIVPLDEPTPAAAPGSCLPAEERQTCRPTVSTCFVDPTVTISSTPVQETVLWQHATRIIRAATQSWSTPPLIMVNHDTKERSDCGALVTEFERGGENASTDWVDIWMHASMMEDTPGADHFLASATVPSGGGTISSTTIHDEFWWYHFDTGNSVDESAMRHAQSGLLMQDSGYSGHANWALWAASPTIGNGAPFSQQGSSTPYNLHSWVRTYPMFFARDNSVYLADDFSFDVDADGTLDAPDASASFSVPDGEDVIPGRVILGRRQALEHYMLIQNVRSGVFNGSSPRVLTATAEDTLDDLLFEASLICHGNGDCSLPFATPDDVAMVVHYWLSRGHSEPVPQGTCPSPTRPPYSGASTLVDDALDLNPWTSP